MITKNSREFQYVTLALPVTRHPERRKGFWGFLTWPFILSDVLAAELFVGRGAQANAEAADQGDGSGSQGGGHPNSTFEDVRNHESAVLSTAQEIQDDDSADEHNSLALQSILNDNKLLQLPGNSAQFRSGSNDAGVGASNGGGGGGDGADGADGSKDNGGGSDLGHSRASGGGDGGLSGSGGAGIDAGVQLNQLFGFDLHLGSDGTFVSNDGGLLRDLNPDHLISDLAPGLGLGEMDLRHLLGFDVHLGSDGVLALSDVNAK